MGDRTAEFTATLALTVAGAGNLAALVASSSRFTMVRLRTAPSCWRWPESVAVAGCGAAAHTCLYLAFAARGRPRSRFLTVVAAGPAVSQSGAGEFVLHDLGRGWRR